MSKPHLQVTYCQGKPFAAYLYLDRRPGDKVANTEPHDGWLVDFTSDGRVIGIDFTRVPTVDLATLNQVLTASHQPALSTADLMPLEAA